MKIVDRILMLACIGHFKPVHNMKNAYVSLHQYCQKWFILSLRNI
jgi:hypothetical protein